MSKPSIDTRHLDELSTASEGDALLGTTPTATVPWPLVAATAGLWVLVTAVWAVVESGTSVTN